jgi:tRNA(Ile)-lysidine synthetase-like protein
VATKICTSKNLAVFHLDHQTRKETTRDFAFVKNLCEVLGVTFYGEVLKTKPSKNQENSWRETRQQWSQKCAEDFGAARILTAHHATDLAETMIFRLVKGAGPEGLSPFDTSTKPFWRLPKSELETYARENDLTWVEDETNQNIEYERNLIRHKILPELRKITPNLEKVLVNESIIFGEISAFLHEHVGAYGHTPLREKKILFSDFQNFPAVLQRIFLRKIAIAIPSFREMEDCLKWLGGSPKGNSEKEIGGLKLRIEKKYLVWS